MGSFKDRIKDWEFKTFYDYKNEIEIKPLILSFGFILFIPLTFFYIISKFVNGHSFRFSDIAFLFVSFLGCCAIGVPLSAVCGFFIDKFKIRPIKGIVFTFLCALICFGSYSLYRMYWPLGDEQVLLEDYTSERQNCRIVVVHKERCKYFRGGWQEKEDYQKYVKGKNYMYCNCVGFSDIELLDAYSKKNRWNVSNDIISDYEKSKGGFDIDEEFEKLENWYDDTDRGHTVYYGYDILKGRYKKINSAELMKEYFYTK